MADRFFPVNLPEFVEEEEGAVTGSTLFDLLHLPYPKLVDKLLNSALHLKQKVVEETWLRSGRGARDYTLYTGALGTAFLLFKAYHVTKNRADLDLCAEIVMGCHQASQGSPLVTFICGKAGVCALGAVVAKEAGDEGLLNLYLSSFREIKFPHDVPNELLYGRAGYLWACSFLNKHIGEGTIPSTHMVLQDHKFLPAAAEAADVVWERGLLKRVGICHGVSGNVYVFLSLYRLTGNMKYLGRAKAFVRFLLDWADKLIAEGLMHGGDHPYSLFEGQAGMAYLFFDMINLSEARFPAYEL